MNQSTYSSSSNGFMYFVAALILIFAITAVVFAFKKTHED
jgi:hypothetical protein